MLSHDVRYGLRSFRKSPITTAAVIASLAIGIGANTAVFSVINGLLLRPLPYPDSDRLALLWLQSPERGVQQEWPSPADYFELKSQNHVFEDMAICHGRSMVLTKQRQPAERVDVFAASSSLLSMLGGHAVVGRSLLPGDDAAGQAPVAVLTYGAWRRLFGGDRKIVGRVVRLHDTPHTVVGVLAPDFDATHEVVPTIVGAHSPDFVLSLPFDAYSKQSRDDIYNILVRLKPGISMKAAQAEVDLIARRIRDQDRRDRTFKITVIPLLEQVVGNTRRPVLLLLCSVVMVLLIACANVASLLLSRAEARQKESAIRAALGADRGRLIRQLLTESSVLALCGGAAGLALAFVTLFVIRTVNPGDIPRLAYIGVDGSVLRFTFAVSIVTAVAFGLAPALHATRGDLNTALKSGRVRANTSRVSRYFNGGHGVLVVSEVALSLILLMAAGLLARSFRSLGRVNLGFNPDHVVSMRVMLPVAHYHDDASVAMCYRSLLGRLTTIRGVLAVGGTTELPLTPRRPGGEGFIVEGYARAVNAPELRANVRVATPDYFRVMQIPLVRGRVFNDHDTRGSQGAVLLDEEAARTFWPSLDPIGRHIKTADDSSEPWSTVVGIVRTVKQFSVEPDAPPVVYFPYTQAADRVLYIVARTARDPSDMAGPITEGVRSFDRNIPVYDVSTMRDRLRSSLARQRFSTVLASAFAFFALALAIVGVYGVLSYRVAQSTRDIGIRMAVGARQRSIFALVLHRGGILVATGIAVGVIGALATTRILASFLFGIRPIDALTFTSAAGMLVITGAIAMYVPAHRATKIDPMDALRAE